jgi:hypothetical protein
MLRLRAAAAERIMILNEKGLRRGRKVVAAATEEAIYKALGMQTVPPELREGRDEIARALAGTLPELVKDSDTIGKPRKTASVIVCSGIGRGFYSRPSQMRCTGAFCPRCFSNRGRKPASNCTREHLAIRRVATHRLYARRHELED